MLRVRAAKQVILLFLVTISAYFIVFTLIEDRRAENGPWQITFTAEAGAPAIVIHQPKLGIQNVKLTFPGGAISTDTSQTIAFDTARETPFAVPFGQCVFLDTTSLPGNVTLQIHGHQIQLLPRVLTIDAKEQAWKSDAVIPLNANVPTAGQPK